jgi:hypothetical protein
MPDAGGHPVLDYRSASVGGNHDRYSRAAIASIILAALVALPCIYPPFAYALFRALPLWLVIAVPAAVLLFNIAATFHLLRAPNHILGDGMMAAGVAISGSVCLFVVSALVLMRI